MANGSRRSDIFASLNGNIRHYVWRMPSPRPPCRVPTRNPTLDRGAIRIDRPPFLERTRASDPNVYRTCPAVAFGLPSHGWIPGEREYLPTTIETWNGLFFFSLSRTRSTEDEKASVFLCLVHGKLSDGAMRARNVSYRNSSRCMKETRLERETKGNARHSTLSWLFEGNDVFSTSDWSRRKTILTLVSIFAMQGIGMRPAWPANEAVLKALKARDRQLRAASQMDVLQRVRDCIEQTQRVKLLVQAGELRAAREQLRVGKLSHLRLDMKDAAEVLSTARPSFDRFEALEVTGMLEALDASLKREAQHDALMETEMLLTQLREILHELSVGMPLP